MPSALQWLLSLGCAALLLGVIAAQRMAPPVLVAASSGAWLWAALISSLIGLAQYLGLADGLSPWLNQTALGEAFAHLRQRNQFATLCNMGLAALLWWQARRAPEASVLPVGRARQPVALLLMAAVLALGNASSSSRTGLLQLLLLGVGVALWACQDGRSGAPVATAMGAAGPVPHVRPTQLLLFAMGVYVLGLLALPYALGRDWHSVGLLARMAETDMGCTSRVTLWRNVLYLIAQKPWWGWGWGELDYAHYITLYPGPRFCDILDNAHNLPLHLAVELGVPVALLVCVGGVALVWRARPWRETDPARRVAWAVLALILTHSLLEYPLWYGPFLLAVLLCLGLLSRRAKSSGLSVAANGRADVVRWPWRLRLALGCAALLVAAAAYLGWDYYRVSQLYLPLSARSPAYQEHTLEKVRTSVVFANYVAYAELTTTVLNAHNAQHVYATAQRLLHFSPEPRVIEKLLDSAILLGYEGEVQAHQARYRAAFGADYQRWQERVTGAAD